MNNNRYIRVVAIALLFAMVHYVAGYRLMYSLGILYAKEEAKECMVEKTCNIEKFVLTTADYNSLKWSEPNKEFSFYNEMYDVVSIQKSDTGYTITAYPDDNETGWVSSFHNFEKEIFHPDQGAKGTKSAEAIMSSFQKEYTPLVEFKIAIPIESLFTFPCIAVKQHPLQVANIIWHPPTC